MRAVSHEGRNARLQEVREEGVLELHDAPRPVQELQGVVT